MKLIIDSDYLCHTAKHSIKDLSWEGQQVGVIFGFLRQVLSLAIVFKTREFIFVWDSKNSLRREVFPNYKLNRRTKTKTDEEKEFDASAYKQFHRLKTEVLFNLGFKNIYEQNGYEGDDLIAILVKNYPKEKFTIISADEDLFQILSDNVSLYSLKKKQLYTKQNLWDDFHIAPKEWAEVKSISGCSSDDIPGVVGVKDITASKFVARTLSKHSLAYQAIQVSSDRILENQLLVSLPFPNIKSILLVPDNLLILKNFRLMCEEFGFRSFLNENQLKQWKQNIFFD